MGIRRLSRRTAKAQAQADAKAKDGAAISVPPPPVPPYAATASTARIPTDLTEDLPRVAADLRRRITHHREAAVRAASDTAVWRQWSDLGRGYLALGLTRLLRTRPVRTMTIFIATTASEGPNPSTALRPAPDRRPPGPDATP